MQKLWLTLAEKWKTIKENNDTFFKKKLSISIEYLLAVNNVKRKAIMWNKRRNIDLFSIYSWVIQWFQFESSLLTFL